MSEHALPPLIHPWIKRLLDQRADELFTLVQSYGSPLNIVFPQIAGENVQAIHDALRPYRLDHEVLFGVKATKSDALLEGALKAGAGVDVSSIYELDAALRAGASPSQICASGPAKTAEFHQALIKHGALISVDSVEEFSDLEAIAGDQEVRVLLRFRPIGASRSRFGMSESEVRECLHRLATPGSRFSFEGFHFHVSGYDVAPRAQAIRELTPLVHLSRSVGLRPSIINIGGGMPVRYVDGNTYSAFITRHSHETYVNGRFPASLYPYGGEIDAPAWVESLLESEHAEGVSIAAYLRREGLRLFLEPGRSVVDQAAISLFRITRTKARSMGSAIFVEGSSFSACETWFRSEFLVDPILLKHAESAEENAPAFIAGHSCLDEDVLSYRLIQFPAAPAPGDLLIYCNTAGYQMDLLENEFHRHPMPARVAMTFAPDGAPTVVNDRGDVG